MFVDSSIELGFTAIFFPATAKQFMLSALIGYMIGIERAWRGKVASLRTFSTICAGSCLFTMLSVHAMAGVVNPPHDITRIAAQIVTGIGFLGGGVIFRSGNRIEGVTTGALVWLTAAIGMACGFNQVALVGWVVVVGIFFHFLSIATHRLIAYGRLMRNRKSGSNRLAHLSDDEDDEI